MTDQQTQSWNATPAAIEHAEAHGVDLGAVEGTGADGKVTKPDVEAHLETDTGGTVPADQLVSTVRTDDGLRGLKRLGHEDATGELDAGVGRVADPS